MEFRANNVAEKLNEEARRHLTESLTDEKSGLQAFEQLLEKLGNAVDGYPDWHPILTTPPKISSRHAYGLSDVPAYQPADHTVSFVRGIVTCPYTREAGDEIISAVESFPALVAYRLNTPLYADGAYPVVVEAIEIELEADGTINSKQAIALFAEQAVKEIQNAEVAETWWNIRPLILGRPHGSRSSLFVNQHAGQHMRKILEALNNSGVYGKIAEKSLEMLSLKKRDTIRETLLQAAVSRWDKTAEEFTFTLRGETCLATVRDLWNDGDELEISVRIGSFDLHVRGSYKPRENRFTGENPRGKRAVAEKFL